MTGRRTRTACALLCVAALAVPGYAGAATGHQRPADDTVNLHSAAGIVVKTVKRIDSRQVLATIVPAALGRAITVRILLPVGYQAHPARPYPVLYLYPGTSGHSYDWMTAGDAPRTTAPYRLVTVSSDIGFNGDGGGWFTNWVDTKTKLGPSQWETYDIDELIPWIDANLPTIRSRDGRAVAGLSQGGYGSTELAARDPDLFIETGSFSGAPEIDRDPQIRAGAYGVIAATMAGLNGVEPNAPFGSPATDQINWQGHDPATLVDNLRPVRLWFATADGLPGQYDDPASNPPGTVEAGGIEGATHESTEYFLMHARAAHIPAYVYDYGRGTHTWPYWARDLRRFVPMLMRTFADPPPQPSTVSYTSIDPTWSQWGWQVSLKRSAAQQFSTLSDAGPDGFTITGSGRVMVVTPPVYAPGSTCRVDESQSGRNSASGFAGGATADGHGRLHIELSLAATPITATVRILPWPKEERP
jgi:S-formylglutathione hydrolase FrmB